MPYIINEDGKKTEDFVGFELEPNTWNVGLLGEWYTHTTYMPITCTTSYKYAKEMYDTAQKLTSCGVSAVICFGNVMVEPHNLDENGKEIPECCLDESCSDCVDWINYSNSLSYLPDQGPLLNVIPDSPWGAERKSD